MTEKNRPAQFKTNAAGDTYATQLDQMTLVELRDYARSLELAWEGFARGELIQRIRDAQQKRQVEGAKAPNWVKKPWQRFINPNEIRISLLSLKDSGFPAVLKDGEVVELRLNPEDKTVTPEWWINGNQSLPTGQGIRARMVKGKSGIVVNVINFGWWNTDGVNKEGHSINRLRDTHSALEAAFEWLDAQKQANDRVEAFRFPKKDAQTLKDVLAPVVDSKQGRVKRETDEDDHQDE